MYRNPRYVYDHAARDAGLSSVTVSGSAATDFPQERLTDGLGNRPFQFAVLQVNNVLDVDLWANTATSGTVTVARMLIPDGHTLSGIDYHLAQSVSPDFIDGGEVLISGTLGSAIDVEFGPTSSGHLRLSFDSSSQPELSELWYGNTRTTTRGPDPAWIDQKVSNVNRTTLRSGERYALTLGQERRQIAYTYHRLSATDLAVFQDLLTATDQGVEPFWLDTTDDTEAPLFVHLVTDIAISQDRPNPKATGTTFSVQITMLEHIA